MLHFTNFINYLHDTNKIHLIFTVPCAEGTYFDNSTESCQLCPKGYYQSLEAQSACQMCEEGTTTKGLGAAVHSDCDGK